MHSESKTNAGLKQYRDLVLSRLNRKPTQAEMAVVRDALRIGADGEEVGAFIGYLEFQITSMHEMLDQLPDRIKNGQIEILKVWRADDKSCFTEMGKSFADQFGEEFRRNIEKNMPDFSKDFISIKNRISENRAEVRRQSKIAIGIAAGAGLAAIITLILALWLGSARYDAGYNAGEKAGYEKAQPEDER